VLSSPSTYRVNPALRLHWRMWDDAYVVFDEASGQTHHMDAVRAYVLDLMGDGTKQHQDLLGELSKFPALTGQPELQGMLSAMIEEFCTNGLVEVVTL